MVTCSASGRSFALLVLLKAIAEEGRAKVLPLYNSHEILLVNSVKVLLLTLQMHLRLWSSHGRVSVHDQRTLFESISHLLFTEDRCERKTQPVGPFFTHLPNTLRSLSLLFHITGGKPMFFGVSAHCSLHHLVFRWSSHLFTALDASFEVFYYFLVN